jgi:hypothetical protein
MPQIEGALLTQLMVDNLSAAQFARCVGTTELYTDGNAWCFKTIGLCIADPRCRTGFGATPAEAIRDAFTTHNNAADELEQARARIAELEAALSSMVGRFGGFGVCALDHAAIGVAREALDLRGKDGE